MKNIAKKHINAISHNIFMLKMVMKYAPQIVYFGCVFSVLQSISWFIEHILGFQYILEAIEAGKSFSVVVLWIAIIWITTLIQHIADAVYNKVIFPKYNVILQSSLKELFCRKAWELDLACYDDTNYYNEFIWSIENVLNRAVQTSDMLRNLIGKVLSILLSGAFFLSYDKLGLVFIAVSFAGNYLLSLLLNKLRYPYLMEMKFKERKRNYFKRVFYLNDYSKELRLNPISGRLKEEFHKSNDDISSFIKKKTPVFVLVDFIRKYFFSTLLFNGLYIFYLVYNIIILQTMPFSSFLSLYRSSTNATDSLSSLAQIFTNLHDNSLYIERLRRFLETEPTVVSLPDSVPMPETIETIEFRNVCFSYDGKKEILHDISFSLNPGERHMSLVGHNGAGKTTLVKLMLRLYDATSGEILLNGVNIKRYDLEQYRRRLGVIFQNFQIFAIDLDENVKMDECVESDEPAIIDSLKRAGFTERLAKMKDGLKTPLSTEFRKDGVELSGGEKQKVAIARMFYRNSDVLILDEPSSALDPLSEYEFYNAVDEASEDKMLVTVSHRLASTKNADKILVLENGRIAESGTHKQLMELNGIYSRMFYLQAHRYSQILSQKND